MELPKITTIEELAQFIEKLPDNDDENAVHGFDMATASLYVPARQHPCGTAACIGGWASAVTGSGTVVSFLDALAALVGLENFPITYMAFARASESLCYPKNEAVWRSTPQQGAAALREWHANGFDGDAAWEKAMGAS